jgi:hypothetical protein
MNPLAKLDGFLQKAWNNVRFAAEIGKGAYNLPTEPVREKLKGRGWSFEFDCLGGSAACGGLYAAPVILHIPHLDGISIVNNEPLEQLYKSMRREAADAVYSPRF